MRETRLLIDSKRLQHNLDVFKSLIHPDTHILANLKANAYGLGAVPIGKFLASGGVSYFSVAYINEGVYLRKNGITTNLLIFNPSFDDFDDLITYNLEPEVSSIAYLNKLLAYLRQLDIQNFPIHIKLDTGMHRAGIMPEELPLLMTLIKDNNLVRLASVFSHLAAAEDPAEDTFTRRQIALFGEMTEQIKAETGASFFRHLLNTAGIFRFPEAQFDMIRPGLGIFGYNLVADKQKDLLPIASLVTKINQIKNLSEGETVGYNRNYVAEKETRIALLPLGYADGINRLLGQGNYSVRIHGKSVPIVGNISMDTISIDVTGIDCRQGDEVVIFDNQNDVYELAEKLQTIPYEIVAQLAKRIPRMFI